MPGGRFFKERIMVAEHVVDILTLESDWNIQENHPDVGAELLVLVTDASEGSRQMQQPGGGCKS